MRTAPMAPDGSTSPVDVEPSCNRTPTKADWQRISRHWGRRLDEQIAALQRLKGGLDGCIGCGCLSLRSCAFSNPGDVHAEDGAGARLLPDSLRRPHPTRRSAG